MLDDYKLAPINHTSGRDCIRALMEGGADPSMEFKSLSQLYEFFNGDVSWMNQEMLKNMANPQEVRKFLRTSGMAGMFRKE